MTSFQHTQVMHMNTHTDTQTYPQRNTQTHPQIYMHEHIHKYMDTLTQQTCRDIWTDTLIQTQRHTGADTQTHPHRHIQTHTQAMVSVKKTCLRFSCEGVRHFSVQFSSVTQSCPTLCYLIDSSTPAFPVHHQFPELAQSNVYRVSDVIQPSHPLSSPSPPSFNLSQHQGLLQ